MKDTVFLTEQKEGGYTAQCVELPAAISEGDTKKEALANIKEAIGLVIEDMREAISKHPKLIRVEVSA